MLKIQNFSIRYDKKYVYSFVTRESVVFLVDSRLQFPQLRKRLLVLQDSQEVDEIFPVDSYKIIKFFIARILSRRKDYQHKQILCRTGPFANLKVQYKCLTWGSIFIVLKKNVGGRKVPMC